MWRFCCKNCLIFDITKAALCKYSKVYMPKISPYFISAPKNCKRFFWNSVIIVVGHDRRDASGINHYYSTSESWKSFALRSPPENTANVYLFKDRIEFVSRPPSGREAFPPRRFRAGGTLGQSVIGVGVKLMMAHKPNPKLSFWKLCEIMCLNLYRSFDLNPQRLILFDSYKTLAEIWI